VATVVVDIDAFSSPKPLLSHVPKQGQTMQFDSGERDASDSPCSLWRLWQPSSGQAIAPI
jgi:hypothetical protein